MMADTLTTLRLFAAETLLRAAVAVLPPGEPVEVLRRVHGLWFDRYTQPFRH